MRLRHTLATLAWSCLIVGAGCARNETFDILVRNDTKHALTVVLTKNGPPFERLWAAPEDLAIESPDSDEQHGYAVLAAGQTADVSLKGRFDRGTRGYLRVYRGDLQISDMSAIGPVSPNRLDLPLKPGVNRFVIAEGGGRLVAGEAAPAAPIR